MTVITVPENYAELSYTGNGSSTRYAVTWPVRSSSELVVALNDISPSSIAWTFTPTYNADGGDNGGYVDFATAPANGAEITISRNTKLSRPSSVSLSTTSLPSIVASFNAELAKLTMCIQERVGQGGGGSDSSSTLFDSPEAYGAAGNGTTDDTTAFSNFLQGIAANGRTGKLTGTYRITGAMATVTSGISLEGPGKIYFDIPVSGAPFFPFTIRIPALREVAVSGVTKITDHDFGGQSIKVATLDLANNHGLSQNSVCKIFSDDNIPWGSDEGKLGEPVLIAEVDGNTAYLSAPLRYDYTTNIRIAEYDWSQRVTIRGVYFEGNWDNAEAGLQHSMLDIRGAVSPVIENCTFIGIAGRGITNYSHATVIDNCSFQSGFNAVQEGVVSYGIQDHGTFARVSNCYFQDLRHGYTTDTNNTPGTNWHLFGPTIGFLVADCHAFGCSSAAFDTHSGGEDGMFMGCYASASYAESEGSSSIGFQLRGVRPCIESCVVYGCRVGVQTKAVNELDISGVIIRNYDYNGYGVALRTLNDVTDGRTDKIRVIGGFWRTNFSEVCTITKSHVEIDDTKIKHYNTDNDFPRLVSLSTNSRLDLNRISWDCQDNTGANGCVVVCSVASCEIYGKDLEVTKGSGTWRAWVQGSNQNLVAHISGRCDIAPNTYDGLYNVGGTAKSCRHEIFGSSGTFDTNSYWTAGNSDTTINIDYNSGDYFWVYQVTAAVTVGAISRGNRTGQLLHISNSHTSTHNVTLSNDPADKMAIGEDIVLTPGTGLVLAWDKTGEVWRRVAPPRDTSTVNFISGINLKEGSTTQLSGTDTITFTSTDFDVTTTGTVSLSTDVLRTTWTGSVDADYMDLVTPSLKGYVLEPNAVTHSGAGTLTINYENGNMQTVAVGANITGLTVSNTPVNECSQLTLVLNFTATSTVSFGTTAEWGTAAIPTTYTTGVAAGSIDLVQLLKVPAGTKWMALAVQGFTTAVVS